MNDAQIETAALACMLLNPEIAPEIGDMLHLSDFTCPKRANVWNHMAEMLDDGERVDESTLAASLQVEYPADPVLTAIVSTLPSFGGLLNLDHGIHYANMLRDAGMARSTDEAANRVRGIEKENQRLRLRPGVDDHARELDEIEIDRLERTLRAFASLVMSEPGVAAD